METERDQIAITIEYRGSKKTRIMKTIEDEFGSDVDPDEVTVHLSKIASLAIYEHLD